MDDSVNDGSASQGIDPIPRYVPVQVNGHSAPSIPRAGIQTNDGDRSTRPLIGRTFSLQGGQRPIAVVDDSQARFGARSDWRAC